MKNMTFSYHCYHNPTDIMVCSYCATWCSESSIELFNLNIRQERRKIKRLLNVIANIFIETKNDHIRLFYANMLKEWCEIYI